MEVRILSRSTAFQKFVFRIEEVKLQYERFNGAMSAEITRLVLDRGDSVALLLHDTEKDEVLFTEQFRMPAYDKGPGWLLELPAGVVEHGEDYEVCARRETMEEIGYRVEKLERIASVYVSPGGSSERIHIFHGKVNAACQTGEGGGLEEEGEDIRLVRIPRREAIARAQRGEIADAKTLIGVQWLAMQP